MLAAACGDASTRDGGIDASVDAPPTVDAGSDAALDAAADVDASIGCDSSGTCPAHFFCRTPDGACTDRGLCEARPTTTECMHVPPSPVCACDGTPYASSCAAHAAGVNVSIAGGCP